MKRGGRPRSYITCNAMLLSDSEVVYLLCYHTQSLDGWYSYCSFACSTARYVDSVADLLSTPRTISSYSFLGRSHGCIHR